MTKKNIICLCILILGIVVAFGLDMGLGSSVWLYLWGLAIGGIIAEILNKN
jgi:hypothetical protein